MVGANSWLDQSCVTASVQLLRLQLPQMIMSNWLLAICFCIKLVLLVRIGLHYAADYEPPK